MKKLALALSLFLVASMSLAQAARLSSSSGHRLSLTQDPLLEASNFDPFTITVFVKKTSGGDFSADRQFVRALATSASDARFAQVIWEIADSKIHVKVGGNTGSADLLSVTPVTDQWYFAAVTYTASVWNAYLSPICNGTIGTVATTSSIGTNAFFRGLEVGGSYNGYTGGGDVAMFRGWRSVELNATELLAEYNSFAAPVRTSGLAFDYRFGSGAITTDSGPNGYTLDATNQGAITTTSPGLPATCTRRRILVGGLRSCAASVGGW